jgi:RNA polymerase sigma-70 factor (ECF subfamily)
VIPERVELVRAGQDGDLTALWTLVEQERARVVAIGVAMLGPGPHFDDLVHDVFLVALSRLSSLRDPAAAGAWLRGIARNLCRERLRAKELSWIDADVAAHPDLAPDAQLERQECAEWVWGALGELSAPLREVAVLRYFSRASSYDAIAEVLGVPIGTVRSRLHEVRRKLAAGLHGEPGTYSGWHQALVAERRALIDTVFAEYNEGAGVAQLVNALADDVELHSATDPVVYRGAKAIQRALDVDIDAGVRLRVLEIIAGDGITVVEGTFLNPDDAPDHCPSSTTQLWLHSPRGVRQIRLHYAAPS